MARNINFILTEKDVHQGSGGVVSSDKYKNRKTVKAIVVNSKGKYGFVTSPAHGFCLFPGGGAERDDLEEEIKRECDEELNVKIKVLEKIGIAEEYRNREGKKYETTCFFAKTIKELSEDTRTDEEKKNGLKPVWLSEKEALKTIQEQIEKVKNGEVSFYNTSFNIIRDAKFFTKYINNPK